MADRRIDQEMWVGRKWDDTEAAADTQQSRAVIWMRKQHFFGNV
jgi:hypothetical protein